MNVAAVFLPPNKDIDYELELRVLRALSAGGGHRNVVSLEAEMEIVPVKVVGMAMRVSQVKRENHTYGHRKKGGDEKV